MTVRDKVPARFPEDRPLGEDLGSWWVMHIKPNCEKKVAAYLLNRNISYYFPLYKEKRTIGYFRATKVDRGTPVQRVCVLCAKQGRPQPPV